MIYSDVLPFADDLVFSRDKDEPFILSESHKAGSLLAKRAEQGTIEKTDTVTVRMSVDMIRFLNVAAARVRSTSRNEIINQLLKAGMQAAWEKMSDEEQESFLNDLVNLDLES